MIIRVRYVYWVNRKWIKGIQIKKLIRKYKIKRRFLKIKTLHFGWYIEIKKKDEKFKK